MSPSIASCILPTYNRRAFFPHALRYFLRQDYPNRELIIIDDGADSVRDVVPTDPRIRYVRLAQRHTIGAKRNLACREASGDIILHWDDDDWFAPWRISYQVAELQRTGAIICGVDRLFYYEPKSRRAWEFIYPPTSRPWVAGNTLCYRKSFWQHHPFPEIDVGEDARFVWEGKTNEVHRLESSRFIVGFVHEENICPKNTAGCYWNPRPVEAVYELMGEDVALYHPELKRDDPSRRKALVSASLGLGDILRVTPLVTYFTGFRTYGRARPSGFRMPSP